MHSSPLHSPTRQESEITLVPRAAPVGAPVQVSMGDLPPGTVILVGFGGIGTPHEILTEVVTDGAGTFSVEVQIPAWAELNRNHFFYMAFADQRPRVFSDPFLIPDADGSVRVEGEISNEGVDCLAMRGTDDALYTLTGEVGGATPGTRVVVVGSVTELAGCMQGVTIDVRELRRV